MSAAISRCLRAVSTALHGLGLRFLPATGKYIIEEWEFGHSNADSFRFASEESVALLGLEKGVAEYLDAGVFGKLQEAEIAIVINRSYEAIKTGF